MERQNPDKALLSEAIALMREALRDNRPSFPKSPMRKAEDAMRAFVKTHSPEDFLE